MIMKKLFTFLTLLTLAITTAWAGEKTITISRNDVDWESANTVYNITKGGVQLKMSGGMNNPNFLLMKQQTTITIKSFNFNIKKIVFHCLDNYTNDNLDPFYWGPRTLHIQYSQTHSEYAGKLTYDYLGSTYDACWNSIFTGTYSTNGIAHKKYFDGLPAGYELMFENEGKPVRFASIDITVEQEVGDMYELVTAQNEVTTGTTYMLVNRESYATTQGYALSVNTTGSSATDDILSTPVELIDDGMRVKANSETQFITFEASGNSSYPYCIKAGGNYIRTQSSLVTTTGRRGYHLTKVANKPSADYVNTKVTINTNDVQTNWGYYAAIKYQGSAFSDYAIRHIATYTSGNSTYTYYQFRNMYDQAYSDRRVYLYKPAKQYRVTTEVQPNAAYGSISLRDGILVDNGTNWSQKMDTVQFLVTPAVGYKIGNLSIAYADDATNTVSPLTVSQSINGTLYTFVMPGNDVHIIATFEQVQYHDIVTEVLPYEKCGNIFLTEGYVVQQNQVKSSEGENVVFNVTPNLIDITDESKGYYELYSVTMKVVNENTGEVLSETTLSPDAQDNYHFTMPDYKVIITATFNEPAPEGLFLLGDANNLFWTYNDNGTQKWHAYGPQFKYNSTIGYYIDVYYKGTGNFGDNTGDPYGYFSLSKRYASEDNWSYLEGYRLVASQNNGGNVDITDSELNGDNGAQKPLYTDTDANRNSAFRIPAGIYRIIVNDAMTQMTVIRKDLSMAFDPEGGATAAEAPYISKGTEVTMNTALYNEILAVNSNITTPAGTPSYPADNEPDANFYYKVSTSTDGATYNDVTTASTTNVSTTLNTVNEGITVTEVTATNYLGWITVPGTNYYKVIETPLHWIEHPDKGVEGHKYIVSDRLMGVYAMNNILWAKDVDFDSNNASEKPAGAIDYMRYFTDYMANTAPEGYRSDLTQADAWEQKNWVQLDFSNIEHGDQLAINLVNKYMKAGSVKGTYVDDENYRIVLSAEPELVPVSESGALNYQPNYYCPMNFMSYHGVSDASDYVAGNDVIVQGPTANGKYYYLLNPKIQEYALITFAVWDKANQRFVVPAKDIDVNEANLDGAFEVEWDYNNWDNPDPDVVADQRANMDEFEDAQAYTFHAIIQKPVTAVVSPSASVPARIEPKAGQTPTGNYIVYPLDLVVDRTHIVTAVQTVTAGKAVQSVTYCDLAGRMSRRPLQGVNIVITRYTDGTVTTSKAVF